MLLASAVPVKVGVVLLVILSLSEFPLSDALLKSGVEGVAGAVVSTVMETALEAGLAFPALSVATAVKL